MDYVHQQYRQPQGPDRDVSALFGRVPAEESEEESLRVLQELS